MKRYLIKHSQNGWEYTGHYFIYCQDKCEKVDDYTLLIDGKIKIVFDDEFNLEKDILFATKL